jgi:hypothetical protein
MFGSTHDINIIKEDQRQVPPMIDTRLLKLGLGLRKFGRFQLLSLYMVLFWFLGHFSHFSILQT